MITTVFLIEFKGQKPPLHMNRGGKAVYPRDYPGCLGGEKVGGHSSLIICSCSPSLTGSVAKDDLHQLCTSHEHTGSSLSLSHTHTHTHTPLGRDVHDCSLS